MGAVVAEVRGLVSTHRREQRLRELVLPHLVGNLRHASVRGHRQPLVDGPDAVVRQGHHLRRSGGDPPERAGDPVVDRHRVGGSGLVDRQLETLEEDGLRGGVPELVGHPHGEEPTVVVLP